MQFQKGRFKTKATNSVDRRKMGIGTFKLEHEMRLGWTINTFQNNVKLILGFELLTPLVGVVMLNRYHDNFAHVRFGSFEGIIKMATMWLKEKRWELAGQWECNGFHISLLYGRHERKQTIIESAAFGTNVVFRPEKFVIRADMAKKRMKLVIEGTSNWIFEGKMETFENLRKSLGYSRPCPHLYIPHITIGYFPLNVEEQKLNTKPLLEKYLNMKYLQQSSIKEMNGGLFAVQLAGEEFLVEKNSCTRSPAKSSAVPNGVVKK